MAVVEAEITALRLMRDTEPDGKPKGYRHTVRICTEGAEPDAESRQTLFIGDMIGHAASHTVVFRGPNGKPDFVIGPNRKILPNRWSLTRAEGGEIGALSQKLLGKGAWAGVDAKDAELFRVVDPQSLPRKIAMQALNGAATRYAIMSGDTVLGTISEEKRRRTEGRGVMGFLKKLVATSDPVLRLEPGIDLPDMRLLAMAVFLLFEITVPLDKAA